MHNRAPKRAAGENNSQERGLLSLSRGCCGGNRIIMIAVAVCPARVRLFYDECVVSVGT